jgi:RHS repeat-associated protein
VVQKQYWQNFGNAPYSTSSYEAYGKKGGEFTSFGTAPTHHDPSGFGGQFGYYTDTETGLLCLTHRYYDPGTGKFINRDPIGYGGGMNLYGFAGGNPVNESDPNGTDGFDNVSNFFAGWGDTLSFGGSGRVRQWIGVDDVVDRSSGAYVGGVVVGTVQGFVEGGAGAVGAVRAVRAAGGIRSLIATASAARALRSGGALHASYGYASSASRPAVGAFIKSAISEFKASGGTFAKISGHTPVNSAGNLTLGAYRSQTNTIYLFSSANQGTLVEELIHFQQAKRLGILGKSWNILSPAERLSLEGQAAAIIRGLGFTRK